MRKGLKVRIIGFLTIDSKSGMVQIASSGNSSQASVRTRKCMAIIKDAQGIEEGMVNTLHLRREVFSESGMSRSIRACTK